MIVATATLITILLLGAPSEFYYMESLEKGVKKEVQVKSTKKEINTLLSEYKKEVKAYNKVKKSYMKELDDMINSQFTSAEEFQSWSDELRSLTRDHQLKSIAYRMETGNLISDTEWEGIVGSEKDRMLKEYDKTSKKAAKNSLDKKFAKFEEYILNSDMHECDKIEAVESLSEFQTNIYHLSSFEKEAQLNYHSIILNQHSSLDELETIYANKNEASSDSYDSLVKLHEYMSTNLSEKGWQKFIGQLRKNV